MEAGLNRGPSTLSGSTSKLEQLHRRIWWSCYVRDWLVFLDTDQALRIRDCDFDIEPLCESDFSFDFAPSQDVPGVCKMMCPYASSLGQPQKLASLFMTWTAFCSSLSHVLSSRELIANQRSVGVNQPKDPAARDQHAMEFVSGFKGLLQWLRRLLPCLVDRPLCEEDVGDANFSLAINRVVLHKAYHTATLMLYSSRLAVLTDDQEVQSV